MANYPTLRQSIGSRRDDLRGTESDRAESGKLRQRTRFSQTWYEFYLVHECNATERDTILNHYLAHIGVSFTLVFQGDNASYTVQYANRPVARLADNNSDWSVETRLVTV
jgi:hypothetical protein